MQLILNVHGVNRSFITRDVKYGEVTIPGAEIPATVVELVSDDGTLSQTLTFVEESEESVRDTFQVGGTVTVTYAFNTAPAEDEEAVQGPE